MSTVLSQIEEFALDDIQAAIDSVNQANRLDPPIEFVDMKHKCSADTEKDSKYKITFFADMSNAGQVFSCKYSYNVHGDDVTLCDDLENKVYSSYRRQPVKAASSIFAADGDEVADSIDELADSVDDLQDDVDDIREDDPSIEMDNNIENHLIARCESCGGIFISAIIQSDQPIDHITGICPLCDKETNQYLEWVIKKLDPKNPEEVVEDEEDGFISNIPTGGADF